MDNIITADIRKQVMLDIMNIPEYRKLNEKFQELKRQGNVMQAAIIIQKMKRMEDAVFMSIAKRYIDTRAYADKILQSVTPEDKEKMTISCNALYLLSDTLDQLLTETHGILSRYGIDEDCRFDKLKEVLKQSKDAVYRFDTILSDEHASKIAGDMADSMYKLVYNKASSFTKKLVAYAEKADKKAARHAEVA
jgi:hypothetical protein